jgi:hypothetical protein
MRQEIINKNKERPTKNDRYYDKTEKEPEEIKGARRNKRSQKK